MKTNKNYLYIGLTLIFLLMLYFYYSKIYLPHEKSKAGIVLEVEKPNLEKDAEIDMVLALVSANELVIKQANMVDSLSDGKKDIILNPLLTDTTQNIYTVKVSEKIGEFSVTLFTFLVDANAMKIINKDGRIEGQ